MEDYKKKYEQALEYMRTVYPTLNGVAKEDLEHIFPELKESEDEKIRNEIIQSIQDNMCVIHKEKCIAWLEKQGNKDKLIQELGEYKVKYTQEVLEKHLKTINKDDERLRKTIIAFLKDFAEQGYENAVECIDWLEKQGEQKPAWSEEDERYYDSALWHIKNSCGIEGNIYNWLKSLRERYAWKPSNEQMDALNIFIGEANSYDTAAGYEEAEILSSLYEQLKKLKGE